MLLSRLVKLWKSADVMHKPEKVFSFREGYTFSFECDGHTIDAWFSAWSGEEKVCINGNLLAQQKTHSRQSENVFEIEGVEYRVRMVAQSLLKGPFTCTLLQGEKPIKQQRLVFPRPKHSILRFLFFLALGGGLGLSQSYFHFSWWYAIPVLVIIVFTSIFWSKRYQPFFEEVECA